MLSLTVENATTRVVEAGHVTVEGGCVVLWDDVKNRNAVLDFAYCLRPGERVIRVSKEEYVVQY